MGKALKKLLLCTALAAFILLFMPFSTGEAEAKTVTTDEYDEKSPWIWDFSDGVRFDQRFARVVNKKTGEVLKNGWHIVDDYWYFFTPGGYIFDEYHNGYPIGLPMLGYYWSEDTEPAKWGWKKDGTKWKYMSGFEFLTDTWARIDGKVYYFNEQGHLFSKGWHEIPDFGWIYVKKDGSCLTGWKEINKKWYFFDYYNGLMFSHGGKDTSPVGTAGKKFYYFDEDGVMKEGSGWFALYDYYWYYLNKDSSLKTGWFKYSGKWYYLDPTYGGEMARSIVQMDDPKYSWECYVDGYYIDTNGVMKTGGYRWHKDKKGWWFGKGSYYIKGHIGDIDGQECYFNGEGYLIRSYDRKTGRWNEYLDDPFYGDEW